MFGFGKKQKRQDICLLAETNSVSDERLDAGTLHAESPDTAEAWVLDSKQQCKDKKTGRYIQFVSSMNCKPIKIYRNLTQKDIDTSLISSQTEDQELTWVDYGRNKDGRLLWIGICLAMLTLTICIVVLMKVKGG